MRVFPVAHSVAKTDSPGQTFTETMQAASALTISLPPATTSKQAHTLSATLHLMHSLSLYAHDPIALEIAGTATHQHLLLRATSPEALAHLGAQVQARFPQARLLPLVGAYDPWHLTTDETCVAVQLRPQAASYQSLRVPFTATGPHTQSEAEDDPLLGVLAALTGLPDGIRVISQLVLRPAPLQWSRSAWRKAVEHPLEPERRAEQRTRSSEGRRTPSTATLVLLMILVGVLLLWYAEGRTLSALLPLWVKHAVQTLSRGSMPILVWWQWGQLLGVLCVLLFLWVSIIRLMDVLKGQTTLYDMRAVAHKTTQVAYTAQLRFVVIRPQQMQRDVSEILLARLLAAYRQYHQATGNAFVPHPCPARTCRRWFASTPSRWPSWLSRIHRQAEHICQVFLHRPRSVFAQTPPPGWTRGLPSHALLLSAEEVAALWHLPQVQDPAAVPYLAQQPAHTRLVPQALLHAAAQEAATGHPLVPLGLSVHAGAAFPVALPASMVRQNLLAVASTGKGKSTLFMHLATTRLAHLAHEALMTTHHTLGTPPASLVVVEPHGDLIEQVRGTLPSALWSRVVLVDLAAEDRIIGLNPLDMTAGRTRDKAVDDLITLFKHLWEGAWGPRTENILEYSLRTLADANEQLVRTQVDGAAQQYTLLDVVPLLRHTGFRHSVFAQVADETLLDWWRQYYEPLDRRFQAEIISSVVTKLSKYSSARLARRLLGQPHSTLSFREIIAQGRILLVNTASGVVGADLSALVGTTLLGLLQAALAEQAALAQAERRHLLVLIDEFQTYRGTNYVTLLAELRKYGGSFGLATQSLAYLDQVDKTLRPTVLANIDHLYAFEMAAEDARLLVPELDGIRIDDLTNLPDYTCYAKLSLAGARLPVFSLHLNPPPPVNAQVAAAVARHGTERTTRPVAEVDALLDQQRIARWQQHQAAQQTMPQSSSRSAQATTGQGPLLFDGLSHVSSINPNSPPSLPRRRLRGAGNTPHLPRKPFLAPDGKTPLSIPLPEPSWAEDASLPENLPSVPLDMPEPRGELGSEEREGRW